MDIAGGPRQPLYVTRRYPVHVLWRIRITTRQQVDDMGYDPGESICAPDLQLNAAGAA